MRSDSKKVKQLDKLASQMDRSRNYLVNQAIDQLLEIHAWQIERTCEGHWSWIFQDCPISCHTE
ncbi:MAG: ribbon-helix-helix domain-containing protein [Gammaproteobacteria bacterium]